MTHEPPTKEPHMILTPAVDPHYRVRTGNFPHNGPAVLLYLTDGTHQAHWPGDLPETSPCGIYVTPEMLADLIRTAQDAGWPVAVREENYLAMVKELESASERYEVASTGRAAAEAALRRATEDRDAHAATCANTRGQYDRLHAQYQALKRDYAGLEAEARKEAEEEALALQAQYDKLALDLGAATAEANVLRRERDAAVLAKEDAMRARRTIPDGNVWVPGAYPSRDALMRDLGMPPGALRLVPDARAEADQVIGRLRAELEFQKFRVTELEGLNAAKSTYIADLEAAADRAAAALSRPGVR